MSPQRALCHETWWLLGLTGTVEVSFGDVASVTFSIREMVSGAGCGGSH